MQNRNKSITIKVTDDERTMIEEVAKRYFEGNISLAAREMMRRGKDQFQDYQERTKIM